MTLSHKQDRFECVSIIVVQNGGWVRKWEPNLKVQNVHAPSNSDDIMLP